MRETVESRATGLGLGTGLSAVVGILAGGAGVLHLLAARDHLEHPLIAAAFVGLALAQVAWGALVVWRPSTMVLSAGAIGSIAVVAVWAFSRTAGIPFVDAISEAEPVGIADATATMFELMAAAGAGLLLVLPTQALRTVLPRPGGQRLVAGAASVALLLVVPAFVTEGREHDHAHTEPGALGAAHSHAVPHAATPTEQHAHTDARRAHENTATSHAARAPHAHSAEVAAGDDHGDGGVHLHDDAGAGDDHVGHIEAKSSRRPPPPPEPRGQTSSMLYGPFVLPPAQYGGQAHYNQVLPALVPPCVDCYMTSMTPDLVYADGTSANMSTGPMLHHTVIFDPTRNDPTCGRGDGAVGFIGHRIFASGNERTPMLMPEGFGVRVDRPWWAGIFEIMNESAEPKVVFFKMSVTYLPADDVSIKPVVPVWLDQDNCGDSQFAVPKGESRSRWRWKSTLTGRVVGAGGHVHDGGVAITLSNGTRNERMCTSLAGYGKKPEFMGSVESMTSCWNDRIGVVRAGEYLMIDTYYNMREPRNDVMGIVVAYLYETNDLSGGSPPPEYYTAPPPSNAPPPSGGHSH